MYAALFGLLGVGVGTVLTALAKRWQSDHDLRHERRREQKQAYIEFLAALHAARDEVALLLGDARRVGKAHVGEDIAERLQQARARILSMQTAKAKVAVEGPYEVIVHANRAEDEISIFYSALRIYLDSWALGAEPAELADAAARCLHHRSRAYIAIMEFAGVVFVTVNGPARLPPDRSPEPLDPHLVREVRQWLLSAVADAGGRPLHTGDLSASPYEVGLDSLRIVLLAAQIEQRYGVRQVDFWAWHACSISKIADRIVAAQLTLDRRLQ
jgi:hypothetical protein